MKKTIVIVPFDDETSFSAQALYLVNEFKKKGFTDRRAFLQIVSDKLPEYRTVKGQETLRNYWLGRVRQQGVNDHIESVLESLKAE